MDHIRLLLQIHYDLGACAGAAETLAYLREVHWDDNAKQLAIDRAETANNRRLAEARRLMAEVPRSN